MTSYDKYYSENKNYFGSAHLELIKFFKDQSPLNTVVDLGAGQGRNSIPLFDLGYQVTAVDTSSVGLEQIKVKCPRINILCEDIYKFNTNTYDIVLLDSMLHFYKGDIEKETSYIEKILEEMKPDSILVNAMIASTSKYLVGIINKYSNFVTLENKTFMTDWNTKYHLLIVKKMV